MTLLQLRTTIAALLLICAATGRAQYSPAPTPSAGANAQASAATTPSTSGASSITLATYAKNKISQADLEAWIVGTIPERDRLGWAMSQNNINKVINDLLRVRTVAEEAKKRGLEKDPVLKLRVEQYTEKLLQDLIVQRVEEEANREFEQKRTAFAERAREQYLVNKSRYQKPKEVRASHILMDTRKRNPDEALAKIKVLRERALAGEPFGKLAEANSDDPSARNNKGDLGFFGPGAMDPAFEAAAFALKTPSDISEPVKSQFGWHIIRLEDTTPPKQLTVDEAMPDLMETLRAQYVGTRQQQVVGAYYDQSKVEWNEAAVVALKKGIDPSVFKVPEQTK